MTVVAARPFGAGARSVLIAAALCAVVAARWVATVSGGGDGIVIGLAFGIALTALGLAGGERVAIPVPSSVLVGLVGGGVLAAVALAMRESGPGYLAGPAGAFFPWAAVTVLVATAEELVLRGALFGSLVNSSGITVAVVLTSVIFALIHVPLYGWHVVPLDLGVGFWFAGLRLLGGSVAAPAVAHVVADLATWWL